MTALKRAAIIAVFVIIASAASATDENILKIDFSQDPLNGKCESFLEVSGGRGGGGKWLVIEDETSPASQRAIAQVDTWNKRTNHYALLLYRNGSYRNADIAAHVKMTGPTEAASAGIVFRYNDRNNYYVFEISRSEGAISLYRLTEGKRELLSRVLTSIKLDVWYELIVRCNESETECLLNGKTVFATKLTWFRKGKVGFWTRGDTTARFSDLVIVHYKEKGILEDMRARLTKAAQ
jgi:hypothetical protein